MVGKVKNCEKLIKDIENKIEKWNERSQFSIKGVKNLSRADLDTLVLYADTMKDTGSLYGLMEPLGSIKEILQKYNILAN